MRFKEKEKAVDLFLRPNTPNTFREDLLQQNAIRYVLLSREEARQLTMLGNAPFLKEVFANDDAVIYRTVARQE